MKLIKAQIRFKFDIDKFIACMSMLAEARMQDFDKLKAAKLLYFADKYHLLRYGKPIMGDIYYHLDAGPVPSKALDIMNEIICGDSAFAFKGDVSNKSKFQEFLQVKRPLFHKFPVFNLIKTPEYGCLSESEQEALKETIKRYGALTGKQLIKETHKDTSWIKTENTEEIDYRLFFENDSDAKQEALEYMESLQEDMVLSFGLSS